LTLDGQRNRGGVGSRHYPAHRTFWSRRWPPNGQAALGGSGQRQVMCGSLSLLQVVTVEMAANASAAD